MEIANSTLKNNTVTKTKNLNLPKIWQGVFWKVLSCACFACVNALVRYLSGGSPLNNVNPLSIPAIMAYQNLIGFIILIPFILNNKNKPLFSSKNHGLHLLRVITAVIGIGLWYLSLQYMPITQVVALSFAGPIVTIVGCKIFLKENFNWQRVIAVSLSLLGGFLIIRPDIGIINGFPYGMEIFLPLIAATIFAGDKMITRKLMANQESPVVLTAYLLGFTGLSCLLFSLYTGSFHLDKTNIHWVILLGLAGALAHFTFSKAYELAEVTFLMPFGLSKFILCGIVGYLAFHEIPKTFSMWLGIAVIFFSSLILNIRQRSTKTQS